MWRDRDFERGEISSFMFIGEEFAGYGEAAHKPIITGIHRVRVRNNDDKRTRRIAAMFTAWSRRSPRLLPAPPTISLPSRNCDCDSRSVTPTDLPEEVLLSIFEYLTSARDIAAVREVCQTWRLLVDRTATIWRSLVFDLPRCPSSAFHAETWYRKAADYGNAQAQVCFLFSLFLFIFKNVSVIRYCLPACYVRFPCSPVALSGLEDCVTSFTILLITFLIPFYAFVVPPCIALYLWI